MPKGSKKKRFYYAKLFSFLAVLGTLIVLIRPVASASWDDWSLYLTIITALFWLATIISFVRSSGKEEAEREAERKAVEDVWRKWFSAFQEGKVSEYPKYEAASVGLMLKQGEVCYLATRAVFASGIAHQLQLSEATNTGLSLHGVNVGASKTITNSFSKLQYDEQHAGVLAVCNNRFVFISPPEVFLEIEAQLITPVVWGGWFVFVRVTPREKTDPDIFAFRMNPPNPPWLVASAINRIAVDSRGSVP
jgi:hypothetical protein